jgi:outer membrane receptor protein involved in Fe transport
LTISRGWALIAYSEVDTSKQVSQEIRLTSRGDDRLHWVAGAFYSDLNSTWQEYGANTFYAAPGNPTGIVYESNNPYKIEQAALFADGSYKITDTLKFSTGLRWYRYQSTQLEQEWGDNASVPSPIAPTRTTAADNGFNPRFNLSYSPNADLTTYVSASKGFRPGGANQIVPPPNVPPNCSAGAGRSFGSDSVWDYEVGEKAKLSEDWLVSASGAYTDAKLTQPNAAFSSFLTNVAKNPNGTPYCATTSGCTAPIMNVPKETASLALVYTTAVLTNYQLTARVADVYVGPSFDESYFYGFQLPSYSIASARVGLSTDRWSANLFVDNLTNKVAELTANNTSFQFNIPGLVRYTTNQPRTFGTQINYKF